MLVVKSLLSFDGMLNVFLSGLCCLLMIFCGMMNGLGFEFVLFVDCVLREVVVRVYRERKRMVLVWLGWERVMGKNLK